MQNKTNISFGGDIISNIEAITVPTMIDDIKKIGKFQMSRCTYLSIECSKPSTGWTLDLGNVKVPFFLIGLSGIIIEPDELNDKFDSPLKIDDLFERVESSENLFIDVNDILLPNSYFRSGPHKRGSVYRIPHHVFGYAMSYREGLYSLGDLISLCDNEIKGAQYSDIETSAFHTWSQNQINDAKKNYKADKKKKLKRKP